MSSVPIRPWTNSRLSHAINVLAPNADQGPPPAERTSAYIPRIAIEPKIRLPIRHANGPSPNSSIAAAMTSFTP